MTACGYEEPRSIASFCEIVLQLLNRSRFPTDQLVANPDSMNPELHHNAQVAQPPPEADQAMPDAPASASNPEGSTTGPQSNSNTAEASAPPAAGVDTGDNNTSA